MRFVLYQIGRQGWAMWAGIAIVLCGSTGFGQSYVNFEVKQTSPIRLSPDGTRLFAVNSPDARLSVFDITHPSNPFLIAEIPVGIEPVSVNPRDNDEVWVVNEVSDSVSIVSVSQRIVVDTLYVKDEPADVVFANGKAFVSAGRRNEVHVFDVTNHALLAVIPLFGENPRALAVNSNGTAVYVAFALSGNHTTILPSPIAPPPPLPTNTNLPPPPQTALIIDATNAAWFPSAIPYNVPDYDVAEINADTLVITRYFPHIGTINLAIAVRPGSGEIYVANTEALNRVRFEPNLRAHFIDNRVSRINPIDGTVTHFDLNPGIDYGVLPNLPAATNALSQPTAIAFAPDGSVLYLASFGTDRIARLDPDGNVLARIEVGPPTASGSAVDSRNMRGPRGLALNAGPQRLYVLNRIANTVTIIDTATDSVIREIPVGSFDPTPAVIRQGRGFLYDAKLSGNGSASCAACHIDGELDKIGWDLGDPGGEMTTNSGVVFHPMKGPMMTQTLRGLSGLDPFHWRGDRVNFLQFSNAFSALMGGAIPVQTNMDVFRDFIDTIRFQPNPNRRLDNSLPSTFAGADPAMGAGFMDSFVPTIGTRFPCAICHLSSRPPGTSKSLVNGAIIGQVQSFKAPHLRNQYQRTGFNNAPGANTIVGFGFRHDGTIPDLFSFFSQSFFNTNLRNNSTLKSNLNAFLLCFDTGTAVAVGYSRTLNMTNVFDPACTNDWWVLENQPVTNINLIARGTLDGKWHGLLYMPGTARYVPDSTNLPSYTHAELVAKIGGGDTLTIMGVPPGSGIRMGIDRDLDGVLDADVPFPRIQGELDNGNLVIHWPLSYAGFFLETAEDLSSGLWFTATNPVEILAGQNYVTNGVSSETRFFRLRSALP